MSNIPWLTILWAIPMSGAALVMVLPASARTVAKWLALLISIVISMAALVASEVLARRVGRRMDIE